MSITIEVLLRDPTIQDTDGNTFAPDPGALDWVSVPTVDDPAECKHDVTACLQCADTWAWDHYVRIRDDNGRIIWASPDLPDDDETDT